MSPVSATAQPDTPDRDRLRSLLATQRDAFARDPYPAWPQRRDRLQALEDVLRAHADAICDAIDQDFGCRPAEETRLLELFPALGAIAHARRHGRRWMRPARHLASRWFLPARTALIPRPLGVVGIVVPWNYPLYLAVGPLVDALAAGNRVLLKPSEYTPRFAALLVAMMEAAFPDGEVRVVTGGPDVAAAFVALPLDHVFFTGSTATGRKVMRAAAEHLTPVTLELGGKSPAIIGPDADFAHAVERIMYGKCVNAGQTCIAPDYVLLPAGSEDTFIAQARQVVGNFHPDGIRAGQYTGIITPAHQQRLHQWRDQAVAAGAHAHVLASGDDDDRARRMPPTLLTDVPADTAVMQEEIFGPLLPLVAYHDFDAALAHVTARAHPLALYLFETDAARIEQVCHRVHAGGISVNDTLYHVAQPHLPFGGIGESGLGVCHGIAGFRRFSHQLPVFEQSRLAATRWLNPPYGESFRKLMGVLWRHP